MLVIYDSVYGNTEQVAKAIAGSVSGEVRIARVGEITPSGMGPTDVLIMGSPTMGGRPTEAMQKFLAEVADGSLKGLKVATFDTRYTGRFVKMFGFAADRIMSVLTAKGGETALPPEAFYVKGKRGPLADGELERASNWAKRISA